MASAANRRLVQRRVFPDLASISREAAERFIQLARQQTQRGGRFVVALTGGSTVRPLYELLASEPYRSRVPWERVHVFWGDERCVPPDHAQSNFKMASDALLSRVPLPKANIHRMPVEQDDPVAAALTYERTLRRVFESGEGTIPMFDLVLLGLGEDGHIASLFPRAPALREVAYLVTATTGGHPHLARISLTMPVINHAKHLLWLVAGAKKAVIVQTVLEGPERLDDVPAQMVRPTSGTSLWLMDDAAASLLSTE